MSSRFYCVALAAVFFAGACSHLPDKPPQPDDPKDVKVIEQGDMDAVTVEHPELFSVVPVETRPLADELRAPGVVSPDVSRSVPVNSLVSGRVIQTRARLGDFVHKGDPLLTINSPDLAMAFSDYQKFRADEALAKKQLERAQLLYEHGAIPQKDLEVAQDTEQKAQVDVKTAADRVRILGGDPNQPNSAFLVRAPATGVITEQNVTAAAGVKSLDNSPNLFTISDLSRVWVVADVYENNLAQVRMGENAKVVLNAYPDRSLTGRISNIGSVLDANTRTAKVRIELANPGGLMRPGMFATVTFYSQQKRPRVVVPQTAIMRLHDKDWVFVPEGGKNFKRIEIQAGSVVADGLQEVFSGLKPGDRVVKNALQMEGASQS